MRFCGLRKQKKDLKLQNLNDLHIQIFADTGNLAEIILLKKNPLIKGFTTNPSLMRKAGVKSYEVFAIATLLVTDKPISFEVFADDHLGMMEQAKKISSWGDNVYVKIPVINTKEEFNGQTIEELTNAGIKINVTGVFTFGQVRAVHECLNRLTPNIISIFAGRIADTGIDPIPLMEKTVELFMGHGKTGVLWASTREVLNIFQADKAGCDIITVTPDILDKLPLVGKDLSFYSLETVQQFYNDAKEADYAL